MGKLAVLKIGPGSFEQGFPVTLQIGTEGELRDRQPLPYHLLTEVTGRLPPEPALLQAYQHWQSAYRQLGLRSRLEAHTSPASPAERLQACQKAAQELSDRFNCWLQADSFRPIREKWLECLKTDETVRVLLQTDQPQIQRLPWHLWDLMERYPQAEMALSLPEYEYVEQPIPAKPTIKVLAVLGNSQGLNLQADRACLEQLLDAEIHFLVEPQRQTLSDQLWNQAWDILFFAGHSTSGDRGGQIAINATESLPLDQLRYALKQAVRQGLKLAIFNSCDGLGLAQNLADLGIPQLIVMREPVPDQVAQAFLAGFLTAFAQGLPFYQAVRQARERLQGLEGQFPCATWLPAICQNPTAAPPNWQGLRGITDSLPSASLAPIPVTPTRSRRPVLLNLLGISLASFALVVGSRHLGLLQPLELMAFDQMLRSRSPERADSRFAIIGITEADIQSQARGRGSLSDEALSQVLDLLAQHPPRVIGLDIYRDFSAAPDQVQLAQQLQQHLQLVAVCKASSPEDQMAGIGPPSEVPAERLGFSDLWEDPDGIVRRQVLWITPDPASPCTTSYAFSTQVALRYLDQAGIAPRFTSDDNLQLGKILFRRLRSHSGGYQGLDARGHQILLNYREPLNLAPQVSLQQMLSGQVDLEVFRDRIVLIGVTAESAGDFWSTPYGTGPEQRLPGVILQAQMMSQLVSAVLDQRPLLQVWPLVGELAWILSWSIAGVSISFGVRSPGKWTIALVVASSTLYGTCFWLLILGSWVPFIPALLALWLSSGATQLYIKHQPGFNFPFVSS